MKLHEEVGRGARSTVYRATRDGDEFAVKFYQGPKSLEEAERLYRREASIHASLRHPAVPVIFEVGIFEARPYIVSEFIRGKTLADRLSLGPLETATAVEIGATLAAALEVVHRHGLVHRDIKPRNIMLSESGAVKLIDFGLAGQDLDTADPGIVGTFRYSAPEQTGMLERPVDGRADLYAVGSVLFECVAGHPPFTTEDIGALLHQHAAVRPPRLDTIVEGCNPVLAAIVDKLLSKDPDERYQSARALHHDLVRLEELTTRALRGEELVLGEDDTGPVYRGSIVGRERELRRLQQAYSSARSGAGRVLLVEGPPGCGKSRLLEAFSRRLAHDHHALVLHARCAPSDPYPLAPLREALRTHLTSLHSQREGERQQHLELLRRAVGDRAVILSQLGTEFAEMLGAGGLPSVQRDARELFYQALSAFLLELSDLTHGAVFWIDDVQWLDEASREALSLLSSSISSHHLLLLLSARNDPACQERLKALRLLLDGASLSTIEIGPLEPEHVSELVTEGLGSPLDARFVRQLAARSQGNPLMVWQYLLAMKDGGVLLPSWGRWVIDEDALATLPLPDDLFALMTSRLGQLSPVSREILAVAAMLGPQIDPEPLRFISGFTCFREVQRALGEGLAVRLIERAPQGSGFTFVHDRVREALLATPGLDREKIHQRAADYLDSRTGLSRREVFERARHYIHGYAALKPEATCRTCLEAALLANQDHAYSQADELLSVVDRLAGQAVLDRAVRAAFHKARGTAAFHLDRVDEASSHFLAALDLTENPLERAELRGHIARTAIFTFNTTAGTAELERAFEELGQRLPSAEIRNPQELQTHLYSILAESTATVEAGEGFGTAVGEERTIARALINLCEAGFLIGYYTRNLPFALQCGILALLPAHRLGETAESCQGFATFAILMGLMGRRQAVGRFGGLALSLARKLGDRQTLALTQSTVGQARHLGGESEEALHLQLEVFERYAAWLGPIGFQNCCIDLSWNYFIRGLAEEDLRISRTAIQRLEHQQSVFMAAYTCRASAAAMSAAAVLGLMGRATESFHEVRRLRAIVPADRAVPWISVAGFLVNYFLQQEDFGLEFEEAVRQHRAWQIPPERSALHSNHFYVCHAYARLAMLQHTPDARQAEALQAFRSALTELEAAAATPTLRTHLLVLQANLKRLEGDWNGAWSMLDEAHALACECDNPWALYEEALTRARMLRSRGLSRGAKLEAIRAQTIANLHGWRPRRRRIELEFQLNHIETPTSHEISTSQRHTPQGRGNVSQPQRQLDALISLSHASASVLDPDALARIALDESARILGAERAYLFILDEVTGGLVFQCGRSATRDNLSEPSAYSRTIIDRVAESGNALILSTRSDAQALESESVIAYDLRSVLAAPLLIGEKVRGVIYLDNRLARGIFSQEHAELLRAMGSHIATALQTARAARLEAQLQAESERRRLAETLRELHSSLTSTLNLNEGLERLLDALARELEFERAVIILQGEEWLEPLVFRGFPGDQLPTFYRASEVLRRLSAHRDARAVSRDELSPSGDEAGLVLPLRSRNALTGFVLLLRTARRPFSANDGELGMTLVGQAGIAIENARLFSRVKMMAELDGLTGLYNRREFFRRAEQLFCEASLEGLLLSAIMFDVDHFKHFNDRFGHSTGDQVLRSVARLAAETLRRTDLLGRYGGEEFAVLLPGADTRTALEVGERLRHAIECLRLASDLGELSVTVSVGVATLSPGDDLGSLLTRADRALYASKGRGRNAVTVLDVAEDRITQN